MRLGSAWPPPSMVITRTGLGLDRYWSSRAVEPSDGSMSGNVGFVLVVKAFLRRTNSTMVSACEVMELRVEPALVLAVPPVRARTGRRCR